MYFYLLISKSSITVNQPLRNIIKSDETRILRPDSRAWCATHLGTSNFVGPFARLPTSRPGLYLVFCCNVIALKLLGSGMQTCSVLRWCLQTPPGLLSTPWMGTGESHLFSCSHPHCAESPFSQPGHRKPEIGLVFHMVQWSQGHSS